METMEKKQASLALDTACELLRGVLDTFTDQFPFSCSENNFYPAGENVEWTTGFTTGEYWLAW